MGKIEFKSQICTTREQSERLLKLGLKKETADCALLPLTDKVTSVLVKPSTKDIKNTISAWSLHRLIAMVADTPLQVGSQVGIHVEDTYDMVIQGIEWLISRGQFNKDYLEEKNC